MKIYKTTIILCSLFALMFVVGCASSSNYTRHSRWTSKQFAQNKLPKFDVPVEVNDRVVAWIDYFQGTGRNHFARYLARSGKYIPQMQEILKSYGMPQDLVYLSLIESGFNHKAYSRAKAVGLWQFMRSTGRHYGLDADTWIDERRDAEKATIAAARYLRDLYARFGNWYLAIAAYNAGEGKIERAIKKTGTRNFWEILERDRSYLKAETRDYVPKFIAAAIIAKSPERFGFAHVVYDTPHDVETVFVSGPTDIKVVARCAGVDEDVVHELNSELVRGVIPKGGYKLKLPKGTGKTFEVAFAQIPERERVLSVRHTVRKGESVKRIARRYGVSVKELLAANGFNSAAQVKRGSTIVIPSGGGIRKETSDVASADVKQSGKFAKHRVKKGETLSSISQKYGVSVKDLKKWNRISNGRIHAGRVLRIWSADETVKVASKKNNAKFAGTSTHVVKRGESWWRIAQRYGVSINDLKSWNPSLAERDLVYGQKLKLFADRPSSESATEVASAFKGGAVAEGLPSTSLDSGSVSSGAAASAEQGPAAALSPQSVNMTPVKVPLASNVSSAINLGEFEKNAQPVKTAAKSTKYKVKSGDTLWEIAKRHNVSVGELVEWNNLSGSAKRSIKPGMTLTLLID